MDELELGGVALAMLEALPEGVVVLGPDWTYRYVNPAAATSLGTTAEAMLGRRYHELYPEAVGTPFAQAYARVLETGVAETVDDHYAPWDRWFRNRVLPAGDGIAIFFSDVTEERQAVGQVVRQRDLLRQVLDAAPAGIVLKDLEGRYRVVNRTAARMSGREPEDVLGRSTEDVRPAADAALLRDVEREVARTREPVAREVDLELMPGRRRCYLVVTFPTYDDEGQLDGTGNILTDITAQKRAEADLLATQRRYREVFEGTDLGQVLLDEDATVLEVNEAFCRIAGRPAQEIVGQVPPGTDPGRWRAVLDAGGVEQEYEVVRPDGTVVPVLSSVRVLTGADGRRLVSAIVRDVSEVRALQERLVSAARLEAVGRLAAGVAHDVNNVLAAVTGYAGLLQEHVPADGPAARWVAGVLRSVDRAGDLVEQLMAFTRQQRLEPAVVDLADLVGDLDDMLRRLLPEGVCLRTRATPGVAVLADPTQLQQVVLNLVVNARDALDGHGTIRLEVRERTLEGDEVLPDGRYAELEVVDDGPGMDAATASRCFEPFFTTREGAGGFGLGLSTAYGIARQSAGDLRVRSSPGAGASFRLLLPLRLEPAAPSTPAPAGDLVGRTVLLVDDEATVRALVGQALEQLGAVVVSASDGMTALAVAEGLATAPALLVSDVQMPGLPGPQLVERLRERWPGLPVVLVSGSGRPERWDGAFLRKPFGVEELAAAAAAALAQAVAQG